MLLGRTFGSSIQSLTGFGAPPPPAGTCTQDGQFIWNVGGFWERRQATQNCLYASGYQVGTRFDVPNTGQTVTTPGGIIVSYDMPDDDASSTDPNAKNQSLQVGPFMIPLGASQYTIHWQGQLPSDWSTFIAAELAHDCSNCVFSSMQDATPGHPYGRLRDFFGSDLPTQVNQDLVYLVDPVLENVNGKQAWVNHIKLPDQPVAVVSRPDTGENWGMFMVVMPKDPTLAWDSTTNPYELAFFWRKQPQGVWDWIKRIVGTLVNAVTSVLCQILPAMIATPNPYVKAGAVVLKLSGDCPPTCPTGTIYNQQMNSCLCPLGSTYDTTTKTCVLQTATSALTIPTWLPWVLGAVGILLILASASKKPTTPAPA